MFRFFATRPAPHSIPGFLHSPPPLCARRAIHASSPGRGGIFRNADGKWSTSIDKIGTFTFYEILFVLGGLFTVYGFCETQRAEKRCKELQARAHKLLEKAIDERRKAAKILVAAKECLQQKERGAEEGGEPFDEKEARLKAETLKLLERQEKFLDDLESGEPVGFPLVVDFVRVDRTTCALEMELYMPF